SLETYPVGQTCGTGTTTTVNLDLVKSLGVLSLGTTVDVKIPKDKFGAANLGQIKSISFNTFTKTTEYSIGSIRFYCGANPIALPPFPAKFTGSSITAQTKPYPVGTGGTLVIDSFSTTSKTL